MFLCTQRKFGKFGTAVVHFDTLYAYTHIYFSLHPPHPATVQQNIQSTVSETIQDEKT